MKMEANMNHILIKGLKTGLLIVLSCFLSITTLAAMESNDANYTSIEVKNAGVITGTVTFAGEVPALKEIKVSKDTKVCGNHKTDESLVIDTNTKGIKNVVVFLKEIKTGKKWQIAENDLEMDQKGCIFSPRVVVVPAGQPINMLNNDGILHNIHTRSQLNEEINKAQPKFLKKMKLSFDKPEFVKVTCDVHNWMQGWIVVADHPYYTVTDDKGKFEISDIPAGTYTLEIWHETLGQQSQPVEVKAGETVNLEISFK